MPAILGFLVAKRNSHISQLGDISRDPARLILNSLAADRHPGTSAIDALIGRPDAKLSQRAQLFFHYLDCLANCFAYYAVQLDLAFQFDESLVRVVETLCHDCSNV